MRTPLAIAASILILVGCRAAPTTPPLSPPDPQVPVSTDAPKPLYMTAVPLAPGDSPQSVEARTGGKIMVWQDGTSAIVGLDGQAAQKFAASGGVVEPNTRSLLAGGRMAWMSGYSSVWAGGYSSVWAGGYSSVWAGGSLSLWSSGTFTWMPQNTPTWVHIGLPWAQRMAPHLGEGVKVAVIDTGVDLNHPALREALAPPGEWWDFYAGDATPQEEGVLGQGGYGHGTNVAGIIRQIAPRATLLPIRVLGPDGGGNLGDLAAAIGWAVSKGARVINLSLGTDTRSEVVESAIKMAEARGVFVVASTGNTGDTRVTYPAADAKGAYRLSVTSVTLDDAKSSFATYGKAVEIAAPGENIYGPAPEAHLAAWSGTSMAAPMVSGALALALGEQIAGGDKLADRMLNTAADLYDDSLNRAYKDQLGKGRLDLVPYLGSIIKSK